MLATPGAFCCGGGGVGSERGTRTRSCVRFWREFPDLGGRNLRDSPDVGKAAADRRSNGLWIEGKVEVGEEFRRFQGGRWETPGMHEGKAVRE